MDPLAGLWPEGPGADDDPTVGAAKSNGKLGLIVLHGRSVSQSAGSFTSPCDRRLEAEGGLSGRGDVASSTAVGDTLPGMQRWYGRRAHADS